MKNYLKTHCFFFWHDWVESDGVIPGMKSSEAWYWQLEVCRKCPAERAVLNI